MASPSPHVYNNNSLISNQEQSSYPGEGRLYRFTAVTQRLISLCNTFMALSLFAKLLMMERDSWKRELPVSATSEINWLTAMIIWRGKGANGMMDRVEGWRERRGINESREPRRKLGQHSSPEYLEEPEIHKLCRPAVFRTVSKASFHSAPLL